MKITMTNRFTQEAQVFNELSFSEYCKKNGLLEEDAKPVFNKSWMHFNDCYIALEEEKVEQSSKELTNEKPKSTKKESTGK